MYILSEIITVSTTDGYKKEIIYNCYDFPYDNFLFCSKIYSKKGNYVNLISAFDIETTTIEPDYQYKKYTVKKYQTKFYRYKKEYKQNPYGFMYQWQYCIEDTVCFGRTWEEFNYFINKLRETLNLGDNLNLITYCHNLAFEFQFMKDFVGIEELFAKDVRKPLYFKSKKGIEFRCSYFLSNMSLKKFCENSKGCIYWKADGDLDYSLFRTPKTKLTNEEKGYCYNDVRGLCQCIKSILKSENDTLATIPLTNTGYVRREFRQAMRQNKKNRELFEKLRLTAEQYKMCQDAFRGGNTHASRFFNGTILHDVFSRDISSSYPYVMVYSNEFPMTKFLECTIDSNEKLYRYLKKYALLLTVVLKKPSTTAPIPYIPLSKCIKISENHVIDNGRVLSADWLEITLTNIDLEIILNQYDRDFFTIKKCFYAKKGKLPIELREKVIEFYDKKTTMKGIDSLLYEYLKSKNRLNSAFGMMVSSIVHDEIVYIDNEWKEIKNVDVNGAIDVFYKSRNSFLSYQWGVWVTALARKNLQNMIDEVGHDIIYTDTDSIKFLNAENIQLFEKENKKIIENLMKNDVRAYSDRDGERFYLGTWDDDGHYLRFKTLGAKKYCDEKIKDGKKIFEITVSGMGKEKGAVAVGSIDNFEIGNKFENVGRTVSWYNECKPHKITVNGDTFTTASNIGVLDTTYELGVSKELWEILLEYNLDFKKVHENFKC